MKLKIEQIGDETGFILPEDLVSRLNLGQDSTLLDAEWVEGGLHVMPWNPMSDQTAPAGDAGSRE